MFTRFDSDGARAAQLDDLLLVESELSEDLVRVLTHLGWANGSRLLDAFEPYRMVDDPGNADLRVGGLHQDVVDLRLLVVAQFLREDH